MNENFNVQSAEADEDFEELRQESKMRMLRYWQETRRWGGNHVPRGEIRPSYRIAVEVPMDRPIIQKDADVVLQSGGPAQSRWKHESLVEDLRYRGKRGAPERILEPIDD